MKTIGDIRKQVQSEAPMTVAIAGISEEELLLAKEAEEENLAKFILVGNKKEIKVLKRKHGLENLKGTIHHVEDSSLAPMEAVRLVKEGKADLPMKGQVHTGTFVKAILNKEIGLSAGGRLSQITMFDGYNGELQFLTDCAINVDLSLEIKVEIIKNAVSVYKAFSDEEPKVALLGAVETVSPKMPDTIDSAVITQMNRRGQISSCIIDGPLSLDNAISQEFANTKKIDSPVAGKAQILVSSYLAEANSLSKGIIHYAKKDACSIIAGTRKPVIMTSRTDLAQNKLNTIAVACYMMKKMK